MSLLDYPKIVCASCKSNTWWYQTGNWVCGTCHPPVAEKDILTMRIRKGNWLLSQARIDPNIPHEAVVEGMLRLQELGRKLKQISNECLYIDGRTKVKKCRISAPNIECFTCPNDYWWEREIFDEEAKKEKSQPYQETF